MPSEALAKEGKTVRDELQQLSEKAHLLQAQLDEPYPGAAFEAERFIMGVQNIVLGLRPLLQILHKAEAVPQEIGADGREKMEDTLIEAAA
ncbi:MAG: hypothetical protein AAB853_00510 [Patescibacteria group bacterium]